MARQTRVHRRGVYRTSPARVAWHRVSRSQVRRALAAWEARTRR